MPTDSINPRPCKICLVQHDEEIHEATLNVLHWFHDQVTQSFYYDDPESPIATPEVLPTCQVA